MAAFYEMCSKVKVIVSEVDGVMTEGSSPLDNMNNTLFKTFYMRDFEAINLLKKTFDFVFLSSDNNVSYNIMRSKNIPFFWAKKNKKDVLIEEIFHRYGVGPEEVLYVGCSYSDIECINMIPVSLCPNDAVTSVQRIISARDEIYGRSGIMNTFGGGGVLCDLYEILLPAIRKILDK